MIAFRETALKDPEVVDLLRTRFVCVGIAHNGAGRRKDAEGEFANKVIGSHGGGSLQGFYLINAAAELLGYVYDFRPESVLKTLRDVLAKFRPVDAAPIDFARKDPKFVLPEGGLVVDVTSKILAGYDISESRGDGSAREKIENAWRTSMGREHLWIRRDEAEALVQGSLAESLKKRIVLYHLVDNTRGTPAAWSEKEIKKLEMTYSPQRGRLSGSVLLETPSGDRGYEAELFGFLQVKQGKVVRFDLAAKGQGWGAAKHVNVAPPKGKYTLGIAFKLCDPSDPLHKLVPDAIRCFDGYMR